MSRTTTSRDLLAERAASARRHLGRVRQQNDGTIQAAARIKAAEIDLGLAEGRLEQARDRDAA